MKRLCAFFCVIVLSVLLSGCRIEIPESSCSSGVETHRSSEQNCTDLQTQGVQYGDENSSPLLSSDSLQTYSGSIASSESETLPDEVTSTIKSCTVYIDCKMVLLNIDKLKEGKKAIIPSDGVILPKQKIAIKDGDTAFDVLSRITRKNKIHMEFSSTPGYSSKYIEGIGNLYEFDCGELSGWQFSLNGKFCNTSVSKTSITDGDELCFIYTCDLGKDVGNEYGGQK